MNRTDWYATSWTEAAARCGWVVDWTFRDVMQLRHDKHVLVVRGPDVGLDTHLAYRLAGDKEITAYRLRRAGITTPESIRSDATELISVYRRLGGAAGDLVLKPARGTGGGAGVTVGPTTPAEIAGAVRDAIAHSRSLRIEKRCPGTVVRVLVVRHEAVDAVRRRQAAVIGDGRANVSELVRRENARRRDLASLSTGQIPTLTDHHIALRRQGLNRRSVLSPGQRAWVSQCTNTGSELESERICLTPEAARTAENSARATGVQLAGVDLILGHDGQPTGVLEVNTSPGLHWHVLVRDEPFDPFSAILDRLVG